MWDAIISCFEGKISSFVGSGVIGVVVVKGIRAWMVNGLLKLNMEEDYTPYPTLQSLPAEATNSALFISKDERSVINDVTAVDAGLPS